MSRWGCVLAFVAVCAVARPAAARPDIAKNVLILYSEEVETASYAELDDGLRTALRAARMFPVEIYIEHLDLLRFVDAPHHDTLAGYLRAKYTGRKIDLIVVVSSLAFDFIVDRGEAILPGVPIVFTSVNIRTVQKSALRKNITGIAVRRDYADTIDVILRLQPDTGEIVIPVGSTPIEKSWMADIRASLARFEPRVKMTYLSDLSMADLLTRVRTLPPHTAILYSPLFSNDATGRHFRPEEALSLLTPASSAPIYGTNDSNLGHGIVGGALYELSAVGAAAGDLGVRVLSGEAPSTLPVATLNPVEAMFDARQLARWGIVRDRLPVGSIVRNDDASIWRLYRGYILGSLALVLVQFAMIVGLAMQRRRAQRSELLLKELSGHLLTAQDAERRRIARELHDDFSQRLALLKVGLVNLAREWPRGRAAGQARLDPMIAQTEEFAVDLHTLSHTLHSSKLQLLGLRSALAELCTNVSRHHGVAVDLSGDAVDPRIPSDVALCLYRIAQEGLHNAAKHSGAARISVRLTNTRALLLMQISDGGNGFDQGRTSDGLGLASMRERARLIGGELLIDTAPGRGTTLVAQVRNGQWPH